MDAEMIVMRVVHILAGVVWAGSAIFLAVVLDPRLRALGPDVQRSVTAALAPALRLVLEGGAAVTILAGLALVIRMGRLEDLLDTNWGLAITVGLVTSLLAHATGAIAAATAKRMAHAGRETSDEQAKADRLSNRATLLARITAVMVVIAVVTMAAARFV